MEILENRYIINYDMKQTCITNAKFKQGDIDADILEMHLKNNGLVEDLTNQIIEFRFLKKDGTYVYQDMGHGVSITDAINGVVECKLRSDTLSCPGVVECEVHRTLNDVSLTTLSFTFTVEKSINADGVLSENYIGTIESKIIEWQNNVTAIENNYAPRLTGVETDLADILNKTFKTYGVKRTLGATSPLLDRIYDSMGLVATMPTDDSVVQNDFDNIYPFSQIKECKRDSTGRIYYAGDPGYDVVVGDWLIEIPKFFIQITQDATYRYYATSQYKQAEFWCPQAFKTEAGLELDKIYVGRFKTGKVDGVDVSRPDLIPENYRSIDSFRAAARAKGDYWQLTDLSYVTEVLHMLYLVEYASLYSQDKLGAGMTGFEYNSADAAQIAEDVINRIVVLTTVASRFLVGQQIGIGTTLGINNVADKRYITAINVIDGTTSEIVFDGAAVNIAVGNIVWSSAQRAGQTKNLTKASGKLSGVSGKTSFKYRGLEDPFGNVHEWVDAVLIDNNIAQICRKPSLYSSTLTADYKAVNYININANGYPLEMGFDNNYPEALFPKTIGAGSSTGFTDYYYQTTGLMAAVLGGHAIAGSLAGLFYWGLYCAPSDTCWNVGARLLFKPPV